MKTEKIGLYLGAFDPFHNGHLSVVEKSLEYVNQIIIQPHVDHADFLHGSPLEHRLEMAILATSHLNEINVRREERNVYELRKDGKFRYQLIKWVEEENDGEVWVIIGADKLSNPMYKKPSELLNIPHIVFSRGIADIDILRFSEAIKVENGENLSATNIRKAMYRGRKTADYLPKSVIDYIMNNELYKPCSV